MTHPPLTVLATFVSITIATIGIVNSFVLSKFNERQLEKRRTIDRQISSMKERLTHPRRLTIPLDAILESFEKLRREREKAKILKPKSFENFIGIPSLTLFILSFLISYSIEYPRLIEVEYRALELDVLVLLSHWLFLSGVLFLIPFVCVIVRLLMKYLEPFVPRPCKGELKWTDARCRGKEIKRSFSRENVLEIAVSFTGVVTNGFIDTLLICRDGERKFVVWAPDKSTYLSATKYDEYGILHVEKELDTGILQGRIDEVFHLEFRVGESSYVGESVLLGEKRIYESYVLPKGAKIKQLKIGMYVDPLFAPRLERYCIDELTIVNSDALPH